MVGAFAKSLKRWVTIATYEHGVLGQGEIPAGRLQSQQACESFPVNLVEGPRSEGHWIEETPLCP